MDGSIRDLRQKRTGELTRENDERNEFERDYGRLIHSPSFRRLQGKSQIFGAGSGDYYRTRLTHSLEVAQISRSVSTQLLKGDRYEFLRNGNSAGLILDPIVAESAALAHDMGHPPFGHKGERVLDHRLVYQGYRFEGNAQNFRILLFLEKRFEGTPPINGLDLTSAVLLATNKYPWVLDSEGTKARESLIQSYQSWQLESRSQPSPTDQVTGKTPPPKLGLKGLYPREWATVARIREEWGIPERKQTIEAQVMDLCDDIAYSTHDIEDGVRAGKIQLEHLEGGNGDYERLVKDVANELVRERRKDAIVWPPDIPLEGRVVEVLREYSEQWRTLLKQSNGDVSRTRRELRARWVNRYVTRVGVIDDGNWKRVTFIDGSGKEDTRLRQEMTILKKLAWITLVLDFRVQRLEQRSERIVMGLMRAFRDRQTARTLFPPDWIQRYDRHNADWPWERFVADYIAGFTDAYAEKVYAELYGSKTGSIYDVD